jgi:hypothetical protein
MCEGISRPTKNLQLSRGRLRLCLFQIWKEHGIVDMESPACSKDPDGSSKYLAR